MVWRLSSVCSYRATRNQLIEFPIVENPEFWKLFNFNCGTICPSGRPSQTPPSGGWTEQSLNHQKYCPAVLLSCWQGKVRELIRSGLVIWLFPCQEEEHFIKLEIIKDMQTDADRCEKRKSQIPSLIGKYLISWQCWDEGCGSHSGGLRSPPDTTHGPHLQSENFNTLSCCCCCGHHRLLLLAGKKG